MLGFAAVSFAEARGQDGGQDGAGQCGADGQARRQGVVIFGSSSINDFFGHIIEQDVAALGLRVVRRGMPSAGLARPDFRDVMHELEALPLEDARAVVLYFGGNDAQAMWLWPAERKKPTDAWLKWTDEGWSELYTRRVAELIEEVCLRGVAQAIVLPPADVALDNLQRRLDRIRALQRQAAATTSCGRFVDTTDAAVQEAGGEALHAPDGIHMSRAGAQRLWERLRPRVMDLMR